MAAADNTAVSYLTGQDSRRLPEGKAATREKNLKPGPVELSHLLIN